MRSQEEKKLLAACHGSRFDEIKILLNKGVNPQFFILEGYPENSTEIETFGDS